jgi:hypothetical protein
MNYEFCLSPLGEILNEIKITVFHSKFKTQNSKLI